MNLFPVTLFFAIYCAAFAHGYDFSIDTRTGWIANDLDGSEASSITWTEALVERPQFTWWLSGKPNCSRSGVLKLDFDAENGRSKKNKLLIDMWFVNPTGVTFNIGDASDNEGTGGDSSSFSNDAEVVGRNSDMRVYRNDGLYAPLVGVVQNHLRIIIADGLVIWSNVGERFNFLLNEDRLFALGGQADAKGGTNGDIYLGINRVINKPRRLSIFNFWDAKYRGSGLCRAGIKWLDDINYTTL